MNSDTKEARKTLFCRSRRSNSGVLRAIASAAAVFVFAFASANAQNSPPDRSLPERLSASFASVAKAVEPAVVSIDAKSAVPQVAGKNTRPGGDPDDLADLFGIPVPSRPVYAVGSGFIIDPAGYIITNNHVIANAARVIVKLDSGEELPASVVGTDLETDLAVLKVKFDKPLPFVKFGDSDKAEVGDWVLALGSPFGLDKTVTAGIISQKGRETPFSTAFQKFIQTDAAINQGNSGGPLVNMDGEVIGVNSQIATAGGGSSGIGFALPSTETLNVYRQILADGRVRRGYLGASLDSVKGEFAKVYGLKDARGAIITAVSDKLAPAGLAGLRRGDVIVTFNGKTVQNAVDLIGKVSATRPDETVQIEYLREAGANAAMVSRSVSLKLQERPSADGPSGSNDSRKLPIDKTMTEAKPFGLTLAELTPQYATANKFDGQKGVLIKQVDPASYIADVRTPLGAPAVAEGMLIQRINRTPVTSVAGFTSFASNLGPGDPVVLEMLVFDPERNSADYKIVQFTVR